MLDRQVCPEHYRTEQYENKERFANYWHQIHEVSSLMPGRALEIGTGSGLVAHCLRTREIDLVTLDMDQELKPDVVGSVTGMPFGDSSFDVVLCCEVLEHLPYEDFGPALSEIHRVTRTHAIISLPDATMSYRVFVQVPGHGILKRVLSIPTRGKEHRFDGEHYWEIGKRSFPLSHVCRDVERCGFSIVTSYRVFEVPFNRFFRLDK